jgi:hypothetical protein
MFCDNQSKIAVELFLTAMLICSAQRARFEQGRRLQGYEQQRRQHAHTLLGVAELEIFLFVLYSWVF